MNLTIGQKVRIHLRTDDASEHLPEYLLSLNNQVVKIRDFFVLEGGDWDKNSAPTPDTVGYNPSVDPIARVVSLTCDTDYMEVFEDEIEILEEEYAEI